VKINLILFPLQLLPVTRKVSDVRKTLAQKAQRTQNASLQHSCFTR